MHLQRLPPEEAAVRRYVEDLWLPYNRTLEASVASHELADDVDLVAEELPFRMERVDDEDYELLIAVEDADGDVDLADCDGEFAGFVSTEVETAPSVFERPDRLVVCDVYVREEYRGTGLARDLVDSAAERARKLDCEELALDVDVDNDRALAFYEKLGFDALRHRLTAPVGDL